MKHKSLFPVLFALLAACCIFTTTSYAASSEAEKAALRANDIADCNNIMSWHVWYHASYLNSVELEKVWVKTPKYQKTATWAQNANYWIGMDNIKNYYGPVTPHEQTKGGFQFHVTTTGLVEIAEDRQTAKGVWYTPGAIGMGGSIQGMWERYAIDFVRENGEWKIWHLHVYTDFSYSLKSGSGGMMGGGQGGGQGGGMMGGGQGGGQGGAQGGGMMGGGQGGGQGAPQGMGGGQGQGAPGEQAERFGTESGAGAGMGAMAPSQATAEVGYKEVSSESYADLIPRPPEPYKTFSDTWSYGDPDEVKMFSGPYKEWSEIKKIYKK